MLAHLPAPTDTTMTGEMALGRLLCKGLLQEPSPLSLLPGVPASGSGCRYQGYLKVAKEGFNLSSEGNLGHFSF